MEIEQTVYPLSRYWYSGEYSFYYAYGNSPPQDFLQNCSNKNPEILVLGCGDIRSCFYSLWKNFDINGPARLNGVHFVLNDVSASVLARDILFLYLCIHLPQEERELKKWIAGLWAIWYCHELYPEHNELLNNSLSDLCNYSDKWSCKDNPLYPLVKFSSSITLSKIRKIWKMWLQQDIKVASVEEMRYSRQANNFKRTQNLQLDKSASAFVEDSTKLPRENLPSSLKFEAQKSEVLSYIKKGSVYAERVLGLQLSATKSLVNFTFFEREDGLYNLHYHSLPFRCYFHAVEFKTEVEHAPSNELLVVNKYFTMWPLLANSVQQFSLWIQSSHKVLTTEKESISFTFDCSHALSFCYQLENENSSQFNLIYSSNLIDHLSLPNLILSATPLLKGDGILFTSTLSKKHFTSLDEHINASFGFDCKFIPSILGIRCISHEGDDFSSPVAICPLTVRSIDFLPHEDHLIWEKLKPDTISLVFAQGQQLPTALIKALLGSVKAFVYSLILPSKVPMIMNHLCVESAVKVFQVFMSHTCTEFNPQFWKPLSDVMQTAIKPYIHSMQTQLFLHGIHMHLTVTKVDCPICLKEALSDHIGLFSARVSPQTGTTPTFMALAHKEDQDFAATLCDFALSGGDVHIFDCVSPCSSKNGFLELYFYAPLALVQQNYKVTIALSFLTGIGNIICNIVDLPTQPLSSFLTAFSTFKFFQAVQSDMKLKGSLNDFGDITSHVSDGESSDLEIGLQPQVVSHLASTKLKTRRVSSNILELSLGQSSCQLKCPYPVEYDKISIKISRKKGSIVIHCPRALQDFTEERPLFIVNPDRGLSLFSLLMSEDAVASLSGQQFTKHEIDLIQSCGQDSAELSSLTKVKISLIYFFQRERHFFRLLQPNGNVIGLFLINKWLFNYENRTPVIDLAFCFLEESSTEVLLPIWDVIPPQEIYNVKLNETEHTLFKQVFRYFAARTCGSCSSVNDSKSLYKWLIERNIQEYFTRAVVSYLLYDLDNFNTMDQKPSFIKDIIHAAESVSEKCDCCGKVSSSFKKCSSCRGVKYCDEKCQRAHWKIHKSVCKKVESREKDSIITFRPFPITRYWYGGDFRYYYAYGNTAAEDFLENCLGVKEPQILSLGCGDIRSCFYTFWKHFDLSISEAPRQFDGVHFVLNDCSTPVQARNIVFLYLCIHLPSKANEKKHWLCAMWAIWYCHELYSKHKNVLDNSLRALLKYSDSLDLWASAENPLGLLVRFTSPVVLAEISSIWKIWLEGKVNVASVEQMNFSRCRELQKHGLLKDPTFYAFSYSHALTFIRGDDKSDYHSRQSEVIAYIQEGNCYAETVLNLDLPPLPTTVNFTLYERSDGVYNLHYGSMPFSGYYHTVEFSPATMKSAGVRKSLCDTLLVQTQSFKSLPFLSNSVQQFTMWVQSTNQVLTKESQNQKFSFMFNNLDAISFCQELHHNDSGVANKSLFDVIYTSNLVDHLSLPSLILCSIMLLKETGFLFSSSLYKNFSSDIDNFITSCFGFDCKLLPVILGIRCINHEGGSYASPVMIEPVPVHFADMVKMKRHDRMSVWQKVSAHPLVISQLPQLESGNITDGLFDAFTASVFSLLNKSGEGQCILNNQCVETAVLILQSFASSVNADICNYRFWEPLSSVLQHKMKPYLNCLQTQIFLHNMHMHLAVDEKSCPMCNNFHIKAYLGLFCSKVPLPIKYLTPHFLAFVHQYSSSDVHYLCKEAMSGKDIHIFDCFDGSVDGHTLKLQFFAPNKLVEGDYKVTIALSYMLPEKNMIVSCLPTTNLQDAQIDFVQCYSFSQVTPLHQSNSEDGRFGKLTFHTGDGERMQSEISLSDAALKACSQQKLSTTQVSSDEVKIVCGKFHYNLKYKYPVDYNRINIKFSKAQRNVKIISPRRGHNFAEEKPMFVALPDHQLSLLPQQVKDSIIICHSGLQLEKKERQILDADNRDESLVTPLMSAKKSLMTFFQCKETYFCVWSPQNRLLIQVIINRRLFDYRYRAPTIDMGFYIVNPFSEEAVVMAMANMRNFRNFIVNSAGYDSLCKTLVYFAARTNGTCRSACKPNKFEEICQHNVDRHYKRAVIYLLYRDPDKCGLEMSSTFPADFPFLTPDVAPAGNPSTDQKCDYCSKYFPVTKKCTNCKKVQYCSKDCQTKHWRTHSKDCKKSPQSSDVKSSTPVNFSTPHSSTIEVTKSNKPISVCNFCSKHSDTLKKCKRCGVAQYCGKECQVNHWQQHKLECKTLSQTGRSSAQNHSLATAEDPILPKVKTCAFCGSCSAKLKFCTKCGKASYCGRECQKRHWSDHKKNCS